MAEENSDLLVHDLIGRLFEEPEPLHRANLADTAIAQGMAGTRRRGFVVAGATVSVLAVVAGAVAIAGGGQGAGNDWSVGPDTGQTAPRAYEDAGPTYADRAREVWEQLPKVFGALLPAGVTLSPDQRRAGTVTYVPTGDWEPRIVIRSGGSDAVVEFDLTDSAGFAKRFAQAKTVPVAVPGGTIQVAILPPPGTVDGEPAYEAYYEFVPTDPAKQTIRFWMSGDRKGVAIDAGAFQKMVESPGFAQLQQLLDPSVQASQATVRQRHETEAKINAEAASVLPPGFRLKLDPGAPGRLELVGPGGANAFDWHNITGTPNQIPCVLGSLCFTVNGVPPFAKTRPDGRARLGIYEGWTGNTADSSVVLEVDGKSKPGAVGAVFSVGKAVETLPQGPGLTPQQAMAIIKAPGVAKVIADVRKLVAFN